MNNNLETLSFNELAEITGGGFWREVGYVIYSALEDFGELLVKK